MAQKSASTEGFAQSGGARIYYESTGSGPALVFVHAGVSDSRMWDPQIAEFAPYYRVIRYDLRGFGKSAFVAEPFSYRDDLLSVLRHLGIARAAIVGCSMGGATAIDFALEHPEMVTALVLVGSGVSGLNDPKELSPDAIKSWTEGMRLIEKGDLDGARELEARYWIDGPRRDPAQVDPAYRSRARELHRENFSIERMARQEKPIDPPAIGRLGEIGAPTLLMIGECDSEDLLKLAPRMQAEIRGAKMVTIKNAAHLPSLEHPDEFNSVLREFLSSASK